MRLKMIKLAGFKSFVDPTTLPLMSNLTGIVGPNGCGKSNIIDAVRWVMGEGSARHLRGGSMTDVIFTGSSVRKPVGQAFVELIFDNSDQRLGGEWAQYTEIAIKRLLGRDGQSHYFLNGMRCRRRDITDIFLGTGLGPRSYAIIEQGMISRLIEAKPEELRIFLEEAAGISRYKERRRETEGRIQQTRDNLARLQDVRTEVEKQLAHLQRQAKTAQRYQQLQQQLQQAQIHLLALKLRHLQDNINQIQISIQQQAVSVEANLSQQRALEALSAEQHSQQQALTMQMQAQQAEWYHWSAEVKRLEQTVQHQAQLKQRLQQEQAQLQEACAAIQQHLQVDEQTLAALAEQYAETGALHAEAVHEQAWAESRLEAVEQAWQAGQTQWEQLQQALMQPHRMQEMAQTRIDQLEQQQQRLLQRWQNLQADAGAGLTAQAQEEIELLKIQLEEQAFALEDTQDQQQVIAEQLREAQQQQRLLAQSLAAIQAEVAGVSGQIQALSALQEEALPSHGSSALSRWLQRRQLEHSPHLLQNLTVEPGWELAVEKVLGFMLDALRVEALPILNQEEEVLPAGLTVWAPDEHIAGVAYHPLSLAHKVHSPWGLLPWLAPVWAAESLIQARQWQSQLAPYQSIITPTGFWLGRDWLHQPAVLTSQNSRIQRQRQLAGLQARQQDLLDQQAQLAGQQQQQQREIQHYQQQQAHLQQLLQQQQQQYQQGQIQFSRQQARLEQQQQRQQAVMREMEEIQSHQAQDQAAIVLARQQLQQAQAQITELSARQRALEAARQQHWTQVQLERETLDTVRQQVQALVRQLESALGQQRLLKQQQQRQQAQLDHLAARREELAQQQLVLETPSTDIQMQLTQALTQHQQAEMRLRALQDQMAAVEQQWQQTEHSRQQQVNEGLVLQQALGQARFLQQEYQVRWQLLTDEFVQTGAILETVWQTLAALQPGEAEVVALQAQIDQLAVKIKALGAVNLAAIEEYQALQERQHYLGCQYQDLERALSTLETAMQKMDQETRQRFEQCFKAVNERLQVLFPKLFGGGQALLTMTGEQWLEAGVAIMARPPGKRNSTIHALSGGEKALTAVALVFAIFELNPAPFCLLDEVDAPLDEANVGRFCELVRAMSAQVQFIFITHNKVTMELAQQLTGVTMQEPGVSRLVAVDVERAVQWAGLKK